MCAFAHMCVHVCVHARTHLSVHVCEGGGCRLSLCMHFHAVCLAGVNSASSAQQVWATVDRSLGKDCCTRVPLRAIMDEHPPLMHTHRVNQSILSLSLPLYISTRLVHIYIERESGEQQKKETTICTCIYTYSMECPTEKKQYIYIHIYVLSNESYT